ncbi:uncharacterized protein DFL_001892 [Arthrobotrys flagrans]|uniref:Mid2 domain-containing protein n=1 Tax=Arthrobotrys flagrans TaxID=97331 RepID=A0A437A8Y6_ARTFL|nr:hypothetical protein DFL_001892 [Arthrobotrys flagrans]
MISLRLWLVSLLLALPLYTYSLNHKPNRPVEDVFDKRDLEEVKQDIEKRQQIATDPGVLASVSSVLLSVSEVIRSFTENPESFTAGIDEIEASLSSVILSVSSDLFPILTGDTPTPTPTSDDQASTTEPPFSTGTPGQVITDGTRTGTVGDDGTTRFCSASSYLCPASVEYGCCRDGYACGLLACTPSGILNTPTSRTFGGFTATGGDSTPTSSDATFSFDPATSKGGPSTTGSANNNNNDGDDDGDDEGLSGGAIGGIVGGVVGGIALIAAGIVWFCLSKRKSKKTPAPPDGPKTGPTEAYTGGPIPPQPQMAQYAQQPDPRYQSPPPQHQAPTGYYQPQGQPQGGYPPYGQNVSELGGAAMPYGHKGVEQPQGIQEAPANTISSPQSPPPHQENQAVGGYDGYKGPSGPVYELGN